MNRVSRGFAKLMVIWAMIWVWGCKSKPTEDPTTQQVISQCYRPFFTHARLGDVEAVKKTLSSATIRYYEETVFKAPNPVPRDWADFVTVYEEMDVSDFIHNVHIDGDSATVTDAIGGTLRCVRDGGVWRVDLVKTSVKTDKSPDPLK